jgi:putative protease
MVEEKKDKKDQPEADRQSEGTEVGKITHYFGKIGVGIIELTDSLRVGDKIAIKGATTDIEQTVESMELEHKKVEEAKKGDAIGMKVSDKVREGDTVYKL